MQRQTIRSAFFIQILINKNEEKVAKKSDSVRFDRKTSKFLGLSKEIMENLKLAYKTLDVESELYKMALWLNSPRGKKRVGNMGFIMNWLNNNSAEANFIPATQKDYEPDEDLAAYLHEYLVGLWKDREHILEFNTIRKMN